VSADPELLAIGAAAARIGVAPSTLRTWERRYGLAPTGRSAGGHRRYTGDDLALLERMHALTLAGRTPARAALEALRAAGADGSDDRIDAGADEAAADVAGGTGAAPPARTGGPGGRVLAVPGAGPRVQGLARAASRLDVDAAAEIIEEALAADGVVTTYDTLLRPVLVAAGEAWARTGQGIEVEHLFSEAAVEALRHHRRTLRGGLGDEPPVLLACAPRDHHVIPLHVLSAALAERAVRSRILGSRVPPAALAAAVTRTGARSVFVWSQVASSALAAVPAGMPVRRPPVRLVVGGPGWAATDLPDRVIVAATLTDAVEALAG
jgi:DNA-binding transcriptional MerR regulator